MRHWRIVKEVKATVIETLGYLARSARLLSDTERDQVRSHLAGNPEAGDMIPGSGGLRKMRWTQESRGKGKRGGVRVIHFYALSAGTVYLIDIYSKDEKEDLSNADKKALRAILEIIKESVRRASDAVGTPAPGRAERSKRSHRR